MLLRPAFCFAGEMLTILRKLPGWLKLTTSGTWKTLQPHCTPRKSCLLKLREPETTLCIPTPISMSCPTLCEPLPTLSLPRRGVTLFPCPHQPPLALPFPPPLFFLPFFSLTFPLDYTLTPRLLLCTSIRTPYPSSTSFRLFKVTTSLILANLLCPFVVFGPVSTYSIQFQLLAASFLFALCS